MATSLTKANFSVSLSWTYSDGRTFSPTKNTSSLTGTRDFTNGTGEGFAKAIVLLEYTVASGTPQDIDLRNLTDFFGNTITFTSVKALEVSFPRDSSGGASASVTISPHPSSNGWVGTDTPFADVSDFFRVKNGFTLGLGGDGATGYTTSSSLKVLRVTAATGSATVRLAIMGET